MLGRPERHRLFAVPKGARNDAIFLLMRLEVTHQFFGRFLLLATTREQANEEN